jgi:ABC-type nitrate/sulfonate/bicarbonate transport system ATPase subunit
MSVETLERGVMESATDGAPHQGLVVSNVEKAYRNYEARWGRKYITSELKVLQDINFRAGPGEVVSLLGPSGCGKTTLLRIIAGLAQADSGTIELDGRRVTGPSKDKAVVFQHFGLLPWLDVISNVAFPLRLDGVPPSERMAKAERYVKLVGLNGFERHYPHSLSGGMQQRVGIARALARDPSLLLMDEPFGALDAQTREILQEELLTILSKTRNTVVLVTHSITEAVLVSRTVLVFSTLPGRIKHAVTIPRRAAGTSAAAARTSPERKEIERQLRDMLREDGEVES